MAINQKHNALRKKIETVVFFQKKELIKLDDQLSLVITTEKS